MNRQEMEPETETKQVNLNKQLPITKTGMLIRKPVADVFEAFVNPDITTKFWFTKSSGKLQADKQVRWEWEMYDNLDPCNCESHRAKQAHCDRVARIQWSLHCGMDIRTPRGWHNVRQYHGSWLYWRWG